MVNAGKRKTTGTVHLVATEIDQPFALFCVLPLAWNLYEA
jgi:hypothetical protein